MRGSALLTVTVAIMLGGLVSCSDDEQASSTTLDQTTHTAEPGEPPLASIPGYTYEDLTGTDLTTYQTDVVAASIAANEEMRRTHPELGDLYLGWSGHRVVADGNHVALLALGLINNAYLDAGVLTEDDVMNEMAAYEIEEGATTSTVTIAGKKIISADNVGLHAYLWVDDGIKIALVGSDEGEMRGFVEAYLAAA
jgi:hypothetical protein